MHCLQIWKCVEVVKCLGGIQNEFSGLLWPFLLCFAAVCCNFNHLPILVWCFLVDSAHDSLWLVVDDDVGKPHVRNRAHISASPMGPIHCCSNAVTAKDRSNWPLCPMESFWISGFCDQLWVVTSFCTGYFCGIHFMTPGATASLFSMYHVSNDKVDLKKALPFPAHAFDNNTCVLLTKSSQLLHAFVACFLFFLFSPSWKGTFWMDFPCLACMQLNLQVLECFQCLDYVTQ